MSERTDGGKVGQEDAHEHRLTGAAVLAGLRERAGGRELLDLAEQRGDVELVGGAVRDLLVGREPRELDVVVGGEAGSFDRDAALFARELGSRLSPLPGGRPASAGPSALGGSGVSTSEHERFATALVQWPGGRIDVATRRAESYPAPGALPDVRAGTPDEDLERRDFTVNAIAVALGGPRRGALRHVSGALEDLAAGRLRVLHERSFLDDPTRLLRMARYAARLGFEVEGHTRELAREALAAGALDLIGPHTLSGARVGAELRLALTEETAVGALRAMEEIGLFRALHARLRFDEALARGASELLHAGDERYRDRRPDRAAAKTARHDLLLLAALFQPMALGLKDGVEQAMYGLLDELEFPASDRDLALQAAICADAVADELAVAQAPSEVYDASSRVSLEGTALAGAWGGRQGRALGEAADAAREWLGELRHVELAITGEDLLRAGLHEGPEIGRRLEAVLKLRLDGKLADGREAELKAALDDGVEARR